LRSIGAASQTTSIAYDRTDNPVTVTDPRSNLYSFAYDGLSRVMRETDQEGSQVNLTRDGQDDAASNRITGMTENAAALRSYTYDSGGNILTDTRPGEVFGSSHLCAMISDISIWNRRPCNPSTIPSAQDCHPCLSV
jgi:YD repeat-containing protein